MTQGETQAGVGRELHPQEIKPFITFVEKALRAVSLYSADHPLLNDFIRQFANYLNQITQKIQTSFSLQFRQYQILYKGEVIYSGPQDRSNIAILFYNGGLSGISFLDGLPEAELKEFLKTLARTKDFSGSELSLNNLLWDMNLEYIIHQSYDELTMYDSEVPDLNSIAEKQEFKVPQDMVNHSNLQDVTDFFNLLSEEEIASEFALTETEGALLEEDIGLSETPAIQFVWAALQLFDSERDPRIFTNILRTIQTRLRVEIEEGEFENAALMIQQVESAKLAFELSPEQLGEISMTLQNLVDSDLVQVCLRLLKDSENLNHQAIKTCFGYVNQNLLPEILPFLESENTEEVFQEVIQNLAKENPAILFDFLKDQSAAVISSVCYIIKELGGDRSVFTALMPLIHHEDTQVKTAVLDTLYQLFPRETADMFITKLSDSDKTIRKVARENLPKSENKQVFLKILSMVEDPRFEDLELAEKRELLESLAVCGQENALPVIKNILKQSSLGSFLRLAAQTKKMDLKKSAVRALTFIKAEEAEQLLKEVETSKNEDLVVIAKMALSEREKQTKKK